jgi:signal peptidase II
VRTRLLYTAFFLFLVLLDQAAKLAVITRFDLGDSRSVLGDVLRLTYVRNPGAAFSVSFGGPPVMFVITLLVVVLLIYLYVKGAVHPDTVTGKIALLMIFSGAAGNLIDRILHMGEVVDFIEMGIGRYRWPVYNFADIYITAGMILLIATYLFQRDVPASSGPPIPE